ncbi:zinc finger BED domain-containing protein 4-like [Mercenaria mercenaria]|uniref:zinc finger BED domain-containing protein 4-like n=1 Tax=Mercenaria mercenaria TaxID=6596 RepID=UPI00234F2FB6|nr:zinc finger BED domain-containing protein 4-like [Mercenaria mercenaria]
MRAFLGVTGHFIQEWQLKSVMLACSRFKGRHTGEKIRQEYEETIACFEIGHKVSNIVTDNAANMLKAFNCPLPGFDESQTSDGDDNLKAVESLCDETESCETETDTFDNFPKHCSCFAHSLQLVVKDGLAQCGNHLKQLISKASTIVSYVRKSVLASEYLEDEKRLQAANCTSWNSQLYMIQSVLAVPEDKLSSLDCPQKLSSYERKLLGEVWQLLKPFEEATLEVQRERSVSASLAVPLCISLKAQMKAMASTYNTNMVTTLKASLDKRQSKYEENEDYCMASILDPRFKLPWCESDYDRDQHIALSKMRCSTVVLPSTEHKSPPEKVPKPVGIFSLLPRTPRKQRHVSGRISETDMYLAEDLLDTASDPLHYWESNSEKYPALSKLAQTYLTLPASSAPVEKLFSIGGKMFRAERCSLNDENFEALMFLKCDKAIE